MIYAELLFHRKRDWLWMELTFNRRKDRLYLIIISNKVCPCFCWILFPSKVCPFPCGIKFQHKSCPLFCEELQVLPTSYCQNMTYHKDKGHSTYLLVQENMTYLKNKSHPTYSSVLKKIPGEFNFRYFSIPTYDVYYDQKNTSYISTYICDWIRKVLFHSP